MSVICREGLGVGGKCEIGEGARRGLLFRWMSGVCQCRVGATTSVRQALVLLAVWLLGFELDARTMNEGLRC